MAQSSPSSFPSDLQAQETLLSGLSQRIRAGDSNALFEAAKLPAQVAIPYISRWANSSLGSGPVDDQTVSAALREVPGYADYLQQDMSKRTAEGRVPVEDFDTLRIIGTPEAASIIAPYLFDFKTVTPQDRDLAGDSNVGEAVYRLAQMKLAGAPPPQPIEMSNSAYLMQWQRWAIAKGFVPQSWSSRVGAPASWLKLDAMDRPAPTPLAAKSPQPVRLAGSPLPAATRSPTLANNLSSAGSSSALETKPFGYTFVIVGGVTVALLIIGGIFAWKRRSR